MDDIKVKVGGSIKGTPRKVRSDKRICVKTNLSQDSHLLLHRLSSTLRISKTKLATEIVEMMLINPNFLRFIQDQFKVPDEHRITPITSNGKIVY